MSDYTLGDTIYYAFTTRAFATGVPTALAGSPTLEIYENDSVTPIVEGASKLVLTQNLNSINGFNLATITATSGNGFEAGKTYHIIIKTGTVGGTSVVGEVVGRFTLNASAAFTRLGAPAGASVSADVAAVKSDTAAILVDTGTTLDGRIPAALVGGKMDSVVPDTQKVDLNTIKTQAVAVSGAGTVTFPNATIGTGTSTYAGGAVASVTAPVTVGTNSDKAGYSISGVKTTLDALNDIAATAIVSGGAITTAAGAVSTVTNTTQLNGSATVVLTDASSDAVIADAVWNAATATYGGAGSYGLLVETDLDAAISSRSTYAGGDTAGTTTLLTRVVGTIAAGTHQPQSGDSYALANGANGFVAIKGDTAAILSDTGTDGVVVAAASKSGYSLTQAFPTNFADLAITVTTGRVTVGTNADKTGYSLSVAPPTSGDIADAVWDEAIAGHLGAGSTGLALNSAGAAGDPWSTALPGAYGAGTAGKIIGDNINATISSRSTYAGGAVASVTGAVGSVTGAVTVGTNNDKTGYALSAAGVTAIWAEVIDGVRSAAQLVRGFAAALLGKASGLDTNAPKYRDIADAKNVISATTDANGNRSVVTLDLS